MAINALDHKTYTYAEYLTFTENEPVEIIDGRIVAMSPAPSRIHQKIILKLSTQIENYITSNNSPCEVYPAPFDVILKYDFSVNHLLSECIRVELPDNGK